MNEWQHISTAPKDGTPILAFLNSGGFSVVIWNRDHWTNCLWNVQPTHWQPLPKPPTE